MEPMDLNMPEELLAKYVAGSATEEETKRVLHWLDADPERYSQLADMEDVWHGVGSAPVVHELNAQAAWQKVSARITTPATTESGAEATVELANEAPVIPIAGDHTPKEEQPAVPAARRRPWWGYAAAAVLLLGLVGGYFGLRLAGNSSVEGTLVAVTESTLQGETRQVTLPDGTIVDLAPRSSLTYNAFEGAETRAVTLRGVAFFDVAKQAKPFIINTGDAQVKVLGTSFTVEARDNAPTVDVVVSTGTVRLSPATNPSASEALVLQPGDHGVYTRENGTLAMLHETPSNHLAWKTRQINFENTPMIQVIATLEEVYDISVEVQDDNVYNCTITATFNNHSLEGLLSVLNATLGLSADISGNTVIIHSAVCQG